MSSYTCMSCGDETPQSMIQLHCKKHTYCDECLEMAMRAALSNEGCYPISCGSTECGPIPDQFIIESLSGKDSANRSLIEAFEAKALEYKTPAKDRTFCSNKDCILVKGRSRFIDYNTCGSQGRVTCPDCGKDTCIFCKDPVEDAAAHMCESSMCDEWVSDHVNSLPEGEHYLWRKCFSCGLWVEKVRDCNHITCACSADFCLICGREWEGLTTCRWGCPKHGAPVYDEDGFNQHGYNPETGLSRDGLPWDPNHSHEEDWGGDVLNDHDEEVDEERIFDDDGLDQHGWNMFGLDREGFASDGFNEEGRDRDGRDRMGFDRQGYDRDGFDYSGHNAGGYGRDGFNAEGFNADRMSRRNLHKDHYDEEGYDGFGFDVWGYSRAGLDAEGYTASGFDIDGWDREGYDRQGYGADRFNRQGLDRSRRNREGWSPEGFNHHHRNLEGDIEPEYHVGPDGNVRQDEDEGPDRSILDCDHNAVFVRGGATCQYCHWQSDIFHHHCTDCGTRMCRDCKYQGMERRNEKIRNKYLWPGTDSFGVAEMFARHERTVIFKEEMESWKDWPPIRRYSISGVLDRLI